MIRLEKICANCSTDIANMEQSYTCEVCKNPIHKQCTELSFAESIALEISQISLRLICKKCATTIENLPTLVSCVKELQKDMQAMKEEITKLKQPQQQRAIRESVGKMKNTADKFNRQELNHQQIPDAAAEYVAENLNNNNSSEHVVDRFQNLLDQLKPKTLQNLLPEFSLLQIDKIEALQSIVDLVYERALNEPNAIAACSPLCKQMAPIKVPVQSKINSEYITFEKLLITRCKNEFEMQFMKTNDAKARSDKLHAMRNIRFIGQLFKQDMIAAEAIIKYLNILLYNRNNETLEYFCTLLSAIGRELESKHVDLTQIMASVKNIVDKDDLIHPKDRYMLQYVIDLKNSDWVPNIRRTNREDSVVSAQHSPVSNLESSGMKKTFAARQSIESSSEVNKSNQWFSNMIYWRKKGPKTSSQGAG